MPTGYTADLYEGKDISFEEFVLKCARNFGALITMRDEPWDAEIPDEFKPSDYHQKALDAAKERLAEVKAWDDDTAEARADADWKLAVEKWEEAEEKRKAQRARYQAMLEQVDAWVPPTADHVNLKGFMQQQLEQSIDFDTKPFWTRPEKQTGKAFRQQHLEKAQHDIRYHTEEHAKEVQRAEERSTWVRELRKSLSGVTA